MYCNHCGKPLIDNARFCTYCGEPVGEAEGQPSQAGEKQPSTKKRKPILMGLIAGLLLTAICSPLVLIARGEVRGSLLNPQNRSGAGQTSAANPEEYPDPAIPDPADSANPSPTWDSPSTEDPQLADSTVENEAEPAAQSTPTPEGIQIDLLAGNALGFSQPPGLVVYADDQAGTTPSWVQLAPFCKTGCFRYNGWLGLMKPGDSYDVIFTEPTSYVGLQFWGDPGDGIAHVYLDGKLVWEGSTEGTDANYPGGAFVNYLQLGNLPKIANHILRIETDPAGGSVVIYFFGSGPVSP